MINLTVIIAKTVYFLLETQIFGMVIGAAIGFAGSILIYHIQRKDSIADAKKLFDQSRERELVIAYKKFFTSTYIFGSSTYNSDVYENASESIKHSYRIRLYDGNAGILSAITNVSILDKDSARLDSLDIIEKRVGRICRILMLLPHPDHEAKLQNHRGEIDKQLEILFDNIQKQYSFPALGAKVPWAAVQRPTSLEQEKIG